MYLIKRLKSFIHAFNGLVYLFRFEPNAQIHLLAIIVVTIAGFWFNINNLEWIAIVICIALVIAAEAVNAAIERFCNLVEPKFNNHVKHIKDLAAGSVLICAVVSVIVALIIFLPKIFYKT
ncbi:MAG: diacylglycerol kinase family protein [Bacteroidia bacterium]